MPRSPSYTVSRCYTDLAIRSQPQRDGMDGCLGVLPIRCQGVNGSCYQEPAPKGWDPWMDAWMDAQKSFLCGVKVSWILLSGASPKGMGCIDGCMDGWMDGWMPRSPSYTVSSCNGSCYQEPAPKGWDPWMDASMDGWMPRSPSYAVSRCNGSCYQEP